MNAPAPSVNHLVADISTSERDELLSLANETAVSTEQLGIPSGIPTILQCTSGEPIETILARRGFTIEAIATNLGGEVVDPYSGLKHLETEKMRTIQSPDKAFRTDPISLLRMARLVSETGCQPSQDMRRLAARDSGNILDVEDRADWGREINGLLMGKAIEPALQLLFDTRVLRFLMPEVAAMVDFEKSCTVHHKDIWDHTKLVTQKASRHLVVRWAALCHDIGKVWTRSVNRQGKVHFFRHEEHGALLFESIAHRVRLQEALTSRVSYLIANHSRVNLYEEDWTDSAVRRLIRQNEGHLGDLLLFSQADFTTKRKSRIAAMQRHLASLESRIEDIRALDAKSPPLNKGIGDAIISNFSLTPCKAVGDLKRLLEHRIEFGELPERAENQVYLSWLRTSEAARDIILSAGGTL
jgi:poly(A) polymerase